MNNEKFALPRRTAQTRPRSMIHAVLFALLPTLTVLVMAAASQAGAHVHVVFAPLAASAFLLYHAPNAATNRLHVVTGAHLIGMLSGVSAAKLLHSGYGAEALALMLCIALLIVSDLVHAPAVPTALLFADSAQSLTQAWAFLASLCILAALGIAQRLLLRAFREVEQSG